MTDSNDVYYARHGGFCYHAKKSCPMLAGGQFRLYDYREITMDEVKKRKLHACRCVYDKSYGRGEG